MKPNIAIPLIAAAVWSLPGCGWFDDPSPDEARLTIEGTPGTPVRVITSLVFVAAINELGVTRVQLIEADTAHRTLPFDSVYTIRGRQRFFVETARLEADLPDIRMRVFVDRDKKFDDGGPLTEGTPFRFVYAFNQQVTNLVELAL